MERLSDCAISELMPQNVDANNIDIDLCAVNYAVNHPRFAVTMETMLGPNVMLWSSSKCPYPSTHFLDQNTFHVSFHPSVLLVCHYGRPDILKDIICSHFCDMDHMVFPSQPQQNWLVSGTDKGVPTLALMRALIDSGVSYVRLLHFGTKMPYCIFPMQDDIVTECGAVSCSELPENEYHISTNVRNFDILAAKVEEPSHWGQQTLYPTFLPLDMCRSPQRSMGGTFTMAFNEGTIKEIKWYNLIYHILQDVSNKKLRVPTQSTRQVARYLKSWANIKERLLNNNHHLGGYQIETLVEHCTLEGALNLYLEREVFKVHEFIYLAHLVVHQLSVPDCLQCLDAKLDLTKAHLARMGVMHGHHTTISITQEIKQILDDLKSLLGYSIHEALHTWFNNP